MNIELRCSEDLDVLKQLQRQERNAKQRDRYRAVLLALDGKTAPEINATMRRIHGVGPGIASMTVLLIEKAYGVRFKGDKVNLYSPDIRVLNSNLN